MTTPERQIRARYNDNTIRVYQAYSRAIAAAAVEAQSLVPPFKLERMTWIKPSFFWMMYRCGWATKAGQERVLAIDITRAGFEWALEHSCASHFDRRSHPSREQWQAVLASSPVRVQWDPERDDQLARLDYRSIQIGLADEAVERYVSDWIVTITDVTDLVSSMRSQEPSERRNAAQSLRDAERPYRVEPAVAERLGMHTSPNE